LVQILDLGTVGQREHLPPRGRCSRAARSRLSPPPL